MKNKQVIMVSLLAFIGILAVAYAAFNTQLKVSGTINASGTFKVTFTNNTTDGQPSCVGTKVGADTPSGTVDVKDASSTATLTVKLYTPGDQVVCTLPVKNSGTLKAKFDSVSVSNSLTASSKPISVAAESQTAAAGVIAAGAKSNITVTVKYNYDGTSQPTEVDLSKTFTVIANYSQAI